jgi:hypothetical protein
LTSKWKKKEERKNVKKNKVQSISSSNNNKPNFTMKGKEKRKKNTKEKLILKRK